MLAVAIAARRPLKCLPILSCRRSAQSSAGSAPHSRQARLAWRSLPPGIRRSATSRRHRAYCGSLSGRSPSPRRARLRISSALSWRPPPRKQADSRKPQDGPRRPRPGAGARPTAARQMATGSTPLGSEHARPPRRTRLPTRLLRSGSDLPRSLWLPCPGSGLPARSPRPSARGRREAEAARRRNGPLPPSRPRSSPPSARPARASSGRTR